MNIEQVLAETKRRITKAEGFEGELDRLVKEHQDVLLSLQRDQWLLGRDADGNKFRPTYLQDDYFLSRKAAKAYQDMKIRLEVKHQQRVTHPLNYPNKESNTPNLIVTGPFHDGTYVEVRGGSYTLGSRYEESSEIEAKYNYKVFGLAPLSKEFVWREYLREGLINYLFR